MNKCNCIVAHSLLPATKLWEGNIFTPVCHSVHRRGGLCLGRRGSLPRAGGLCPGWRGVSVQGGGSLSRGSSVEGGICQGGVLYPGGLCQGCLCPEGVSVMRVSV